jgi:PPOX class probable F420-dependent enzyme
MSRRTQIEMSEEERTKFLAESKTVILCSNGVGGFPHPMPMWFSIDDDGAVLMTTYVRSQKVKNLERDPRVSLLVEAGEDYAELRGIVMYGSAELIRDVERVIDTLIVASGQGDRANPAVRDAMRANASKRVLIRVKPERIVSWDHAKLGGVY